MARGGILCAVLTFLLLPLSSSPLRAYDSIDIKEAGAIVGKVTFKGKAPAPKKITITRDKKVCGKEAKFDESLIVGSNGGVKNVVLYLADIKKGKKVQPPSKLQIDQRGCQFHPHVFIVPAGMKFDLINSDGILHNFRTTGKKNPTLNKAQPKFKKKLKIKLDKPEIVRTNCDVHEWMNGWLVVAAHPYYVLTDDRGKFEISGVPPGTYTLQLWHERLGRKTRKITVKASQQTEASFELSKK